jgi:hypothetical protein
VRAASDAAAGMGGVTAVRGDMSHSLNEIRLGYPLSCSDAANRAQDRRRICPAGLEELAERPSGELVRAETAEAFNGCE